MTHEIIMGIGEISRNEQFFLFLQCFQLNQINVSSFVHIFDIISLFAAELEKPKTGISGKGLKKFVNPQKEYELFTTQSRVLTT